MQNLTQKPQPRKPFDVETIDLVDWGETERAEQAKNNRQASAWKTPAVVAREFAHRLAAKAHAGGWRPVRRAPSRARRAPRRAARRVVRSATRSAPRSGPGGPPAPSRAPSADRGVQ